MIIGGEEIKWYIVWLYLLCGLFLVSSCKNTRNEMLHTLIYNYPIVNCNRYSSPKEKCMVQQFSRCLVICNEGWRTMVPSNASWKNAKIRHSSPNVIITSIYHGLFDVTASTLLRDIHHWQRSPHATLKHNMMEENYLHTTHKLNHLLNLYTPRNYLWSPNFLN